MCMLCKQYRLKLLMYSTKNVTCGIMHISIYYFTHLGLFALQISSYCVQNTLLTNSNKIAIVLHQATIKSWKCRRSRWSLYRQWDWVSNLVIMENKNGSLRLCLDPKPLNTAIRRERYTIPTRAESVVWQTHMYYFRQEGWILASSSHRGVVLFVYVQYPMG